MKRWLAQVVYRHETGPVDVIHDIEELDELSDLVARGPMDDTIIQILILPEDEVAEAAITVEKSWTL